MRESAPNGGGIEAVRREFRACTAKVAARSTAAAALPKTRRATRPITIERYTGY
jgi:hypothetical protein